ncbi:MAG: hypothetical protein KGY38_07395 [Desulfobacterales bacterium]|nr:hypothetical protein [Desulfobacterales bacterium]
MAQSRCPFCGCEQFYVKHPDDEYAIFEFECRDGQVCFGKGVSADDCPEVSDDMEVFCNACAWHDKFHKLK